MLKRLLALIALLLVPAAPALALPAAPAQPAPYTVTGTLFDQSTMTTKKIGANRKIDLGDYDISFHDASYQYTLPLCYSATLVDVTGSRLTPTSFSVGNPLTVSVVENTHAASKVCITRIVRQELHNGTSEGECLQSFQVKHALIDNPTDRVVGVEYNYHLTITNRPTPDCDAQTYGSNPIGTVAPANGRPFLVTLLQDTASGSRELKRWSLTTDTAGGINLSYTFAAAGKYHFQIAPGANTQPGDVIGWAEEITAAAGTTSPSPVPGAATTPPGPSPALVAIAIILGVLVILAGLGFGVWYWLRQRRLRQTPLQEYQRTPKL